MSICELIKKYFPNCEIEDYGIFYNLKVNTDIGNVGFILDFRKRRNLEKYVISRKKDFDSLFRCVEGNYEYIKA